MFFVLPVRRETRFELLEFVNSLIIPWSIFNFIYVMVDLGGNIGLSSNKKILRKI